MKRALRRFVSTLHGTRRVIFFIILALICIIAICIGVYIQFFYRYSDSDPFMIGINIGAQKSEEEIEILKNQFNDLFTNTILVNTDAEIKATKIETRNSNYVYTAYDLTNEDENYYSINAQIPVINVKSDVVSAINATIKSEYYDTASTILNRKEGYTIYNVSYAAFINEDILSVVIRSSLKENGKSEKVTVKTYNYSFSSDKLMTLSDLIQLKEADSKEIQNTINKEIQKQYTNAKIASEEFGNLYERDVNSDMYKIENATTFFLTQDGYVYVVYAYGNNDYTNETDLVIF